MENGFVTNVKIHTRNQRIACLTFRHTRLISAVYNTIHYPCQIFVNTCVFTIFEDDLYDYIINFKFKCNLKNFIKFTNGRHTIIQAYFPLNYVHSLLTRVKMGKFHLGEKNHSLGSS